VGRVPGTGLIKQGGTAESRSQIAAFRP